MKKTGDYHFLLFLIVLLSVVYACEDDENDESDTGITGDVGESCAMQCYSGWCRDHNQADCVSQSCVGLPDETYCTIACELDSHCPTGFVCSEECSDQVAHYPVCVREEDMAVLRTLEYCPAE